MTGVDVEKKIEPGIVVEPSIAPNGPNEASSKDQTLVGF